MLINQKNYQWSYDPIDLLGVKILYDGKVCDKNFNAVLQKVKIFMNSGITIH